MIRRLAACTGDLVTLDEGMAAEQAHGRRLVVGGNDELLLVALDHGFPPPFQLRDDCSVPVSISARRLRLALPSSPHYAQGDDIQKYKKATHCGSQDRYHELGTLTWHEWHQYQGKKADSCSKDEASYEQTLRHGSTAM